ncbi:hypothetical protein [Kitasatospora sp. NPDC001683]
MDAVFTLAWQYAAGQLLPEDLPMAAAETAGGRRGFARPVQPRGAGPG